MRHMKKYLSRSRRAFRLKRQRQFLKYFNYCLIMFDIGNRGASNPSIAFISRK